MHFDLAYFSHHHHVIIYLEQGEKRFVHGTINTAISCFIHKYMNIIKI